MRGTRLTGLLLALAGLLQLGLSLKIAAFNIRTFGETKMSNATLSSYIVRILRRYDIALIQEVRDSHLVAVGKLLDDLNQWVKWSPRRPGGSPASGTQVWGRSLGLAPPQTPDWDVCLLNPGMTQTPTTTWSVSRWAATATRSATSLCSEVKEFAIVPLHSAPSDAVAEINSLYDVYLDVQQKWDLNDIMLMGDFNADCSYVTSSEWSSIRLRTSSTFQWLIPDSADTTATSTNCAYDRIVVAGSLLQSSVVPGSATTFDFQAAYGLSNEMVSVCPGHTAFFLLT
uniref:Deoxyribonuclease n=1 Tax=Capra hircus TaxID=9925 RepID=A0A8C2R869_CAPHI